MLKVVLIENILKFLLIRMIISEIVAIAFTIFLIKSLDQQRLAAPFQFWILAWNMVVSIFTQDGLDMFFR